MNPLMKGLFLQNIPIQVLKTSLSNSGSSLNASIPCTSLCNFRPLWCLQERLYYPLRVCLSCPRAELRSCRHITLNGPHNQFYLSFLIMNTAILSFTKYVPQIVCLFCAKWSFLGILVTAGYGRAHFCHHVHVYGNMDCGIFKWDRGTKLERFCLRINILK